jgi:hypothetical protein
MRKHFGFGLVLVAIAVASMVIPSSVSASPAASHQRVMLQMKHGFGSPTGRFVFYALTEGSLELDSGRYTYAAVEKPPLTRKGQGIAVYVAAAVLSGKRGTFTLRWRGEFVGAGGGNTIGTGTWSIVRGTGAYVGVTGGGRLGCVVFTQRSDTTMQLEGFLTAPGV